MRLLETLPNGTEIWWTRDSILFRTFDGEWNEIRRQYSVGHNESYEKERQLCLGLE